MDGLTFVHLALDSRGFSSIGVTFEDMVVLPREVLTDEDGVSERDFEEEVSVEGVYSFSLLLVEASDG